MAYATAMYWRIDTYDTETGFTTVGDTWAFVTQYNPFVGNTSPDRGEYWDSLLEEWVDDYDPSDSWQFVDGEYQWTDLPDVKGGGRYRNNAVVFAIDENGLGNIMVDNG
jgi:hypothetical protein